MRNLQFSIILLIACIAQPILADVIVRSDLKPDTPLVGQQVVLKVDVLSEKGWAKISRFGEFEIPGAYVKLIDNQGVRLTESLDGKPVSGQQYELFIYPQTDGEIFIPVIPLEVAIQTYGADAGTTISNTQIPSKSFTSRYPDNINQSEGFVSTSQLKVSQSWSNENSESYHVGDAIKRSIYLEAVDIPGMAFTPMRFNTTNGVRIYQDQADVDDVVARGSLTGKRTEHVTYVFQNEGKVTIPDIEIQWWNINAGKVENVLLKGKELNIQTAAAYSSANSVEQINLKRFSVFDIILLIVILSGISIILIRIIPVILKKYWKWKNQLQETEAAYFYRLIRSSKKSEIQTTFNLLMQWLDRINSENKPALLEEFVETYGDEGLIGVINDLNAALLKSEVKSEIKKDTSFDPEEFAKQFSKARQRWLDVQSETDLEKQLLPQLN